MTSDKERQIQDSLVSKEYREALAIEHVNTTLAIQIHKMRENRQWSQSDLANRLGKHQETISQWENPDYGRYSISTLKELASAFDVALLVRFIPFSELVADMVNLSSVRLCPPSFDEERIGAAIGIGITPLSNEVYPNIVSFINSIPSTPSTLISGTFWTVAGKGDGSCRFRKYLGNVLLQNVVTLLLECNKKTSQRGSCTTSASFLERRNVYLTWNGIVTLHLWR